MAKRALCFLKSNRNLKHVFCVSFSLILHAVLQCTSTKSLLYLVLDSGDLNKDIPLKNFWKNVKYSLPWMVTVLVPVMHVLSYTFRLLRSSVWILFGAWLNDLGTFPEHRTKITDFLPEGALLFITTSLFESLGHLSYFLPCNPILDAFHPFIYFRNS